jgi:photosystem II stability/assembly factor-like uncharacterized protein
MPAPWAMPSIRVLTADNIGFRTTSDSKNTSPSSISSSFIPALSEKIYAATTVGAYYTKDAGREWEERMGGMKEVHIVTSIAINHKDPTILYAGTTGGIYRSDDAAMSWKKINNGLIPEKELMASMALGVNAIELDPVNPDIVYAGTTKGSLPHGQQGGTVGTDRTEPAGPLCQQHRDPSHRARADLHRRTREASGKAQIAERPGRR